MAQARFHAGGHPPQDPPSDPAQVFAALAYYHANRDEIDTDLAAEQSETDRLEQQYGRPAGS